MADEDTKTTNQTTDQATLAANSSESNPEEKATSDTAARNAAIMSEVASRIAEAHNILIALSSDPSVDELAAAIGLSICLDRVGKRATAIYSGATPNALEFLKPEETFESSADALQDFVIAINKDKADHLRYKLDGDYVRIFITPYKTRIDEDDLEFSYGDFNIDLVLALDVLSGTDLDAALREHGRIMHDAKVVNITTGNPGKFGEIEWSDKTKSSVSEMVADLLYGIKKIPVEKDEATAFLTGIIAATNRFSNASTTAETMQLASRLMESGANQQLIAENITGDTDNQMFSFNNNIAREHESDATSLEIDHDEESSSEEPSSEKSAASVIADSPDQDENESTSSAASLDLQAVADSLSHIGEEGATTALESTSPVSLTPSPDFVAGIAEPMSKTTTQPEKVLSPSESFLDDTASGPKDYGQMLEDALAEDAAATTPLATPISSAPGIPEPAATGVMSSLDLLQNPAVSAAPTITATPEASSIPEMNYNAIPGEDLLPPPPTPPINIDNNSALPPLPSDAASSTTEPTISAPSTPASSDAAAFQIPTAPNL